MHSGLSGLWGAANEIMAELDAWIEKTDKHPMRLRYKPSDQARLIKLRVWQFRYHLSISDILDLIMPILRGLMQGKKKSRGLGVSVRSLTSLGTERLLQYEIAKQYPDGEHLMIWRDQAIQSQLMTEQLDELEGLQPHERSDKVLDYPDAKSFLDVYSQTIAKKRDVYRSEVSKRWRKRKPYRDNPWR